MIHRPKKSLGQNFLKSETIVDNIIDAANLTSDDIVLEIGPGLGILTKKLLLFAGKVIAVEKDDSLITRLQETLSLEIGNGKLDLVSGDILKLDPEILKTRASATGYKIVANIPYNITGAIIEKFLSTSFQPTQMVLMVQKEVAERIIAKDKKTGNAGKESILSIAVKAYGNPVYICTVKAGNFVPAPTVDSAVISIENISRNNFKTTHHEEVFFQIVKAGFAHKRKTLAGNLKNILEPEIVECALRAVGLRPTARAEDVGIKNWLTMAEIVYTNQYESKYS
jgi:16S rRNA (adenine1518-N6/adenine1519-N6)-dimethyltransferase